MGRISDFVKELSMRVEDQRVYAGKKFAKFPTAENATEYTLLSKFIDEIYLVYKKHTDDQTVDLVVRTDGDWVLCSDRLPHEVGGYLVTYIFPNHSNNAHYCAYSHWRADGRWDEELLFPNEKVIAWKEVKPYEEPLLQSGDR